MQTNLKFGTGIRDNEGGACSPATVTYGSLYSGIGAMDHGFGLAGLLLKWQVENNPFCLRVLQNRWPGVQKHTDVRECGAHNLEPVHLIIGGYPCQDHSIGGTQQGFANQNRSGLWFEYPRIIRELQSRSSNHQPHWVVIENVDNLLRTKYGDTVLENMEEMGYRCQPLVLTAEMLGAPHRRARAWIVCHHESLDLRALGSADPAHWVLPPESERKMKEDREVWERLQKENKEGRPGCPGVEMAALMTAQEDPRLRRAGSEALAASDADAAFYARIVKELGATPGWVDRVGAVGNAVVPQIAMLIGRFIQEYESRIAAARNPSAHADAMIPACEPPCAPKPAELERVGT